MQKTIIYLSLFIFMISIVYAATENVKFLYNPFTARLDRSVSSNQTNFNWTFGNLILIGNISGTSTAWNKSGTDVFLANTGDFVGIGTTAPTKKLVVIGNVNISDSLNVTNTVQATTFIGDGSLLTGISAGGTSVWNSSGSNVFLNDSTALVGIGTSNPSGELSIVGASAQTGDIFIGANTVADLVRFRVATDGTNGGEIQFRTKADGGSLSTAITIRESGNVGIGATAPSIKLAIGDDDTGIDAPASDEMTFNVGNVEFCELSESTNDVMTCNEDSVDIDFVWESNNNANMLFIDGGNDKIGIGTNTPTEVLVVIGNANVTGNLKIDGNVSMNRVLTDVIFEKKIDIGVPGAAGGLDIGEGGSYQKDKNGTTIVQAFTYDASAASGSRFTEFTDLDASNTWLADVGDRLYVGSRNIFWATRFEISTAIGDSVLQMRYYNGSNLTNMTHMGILKNNATSIGIRILNQTAEKEYITWDHEISEDWTTADNIDDLIPNGDTDMYWVVFEIPTAGITNAPVVTEIKVRGTDFDFVSGTSYPILWGDTRIENHERISLTVVKSPGGTTTTDIDIDSAHQQTVFDFNGAGDLVSFLWVIPEAIDTSSPLHVTIDYAANAADTFDIDLSMSKLRNATPIGNSISPDFTETTAVTSAAANTFYTDQLLAEVIPIQNMTAGDELSFEIQRTDATNAMYPLSFVIHYISFSIGEIVTAD